MNTPRLLLLLAAAPLALASCAEGGDDAPPTGSSGSGGSAGSIASGGTSMTSAGTSAGSSTAGSSSGAGASSGGASGAGGGALGGGAAAGSAGAGGGGFAGAAGGSGGSAGGAVCDPKDELPKPTVVNVPGKGAPFTGSHEVVVETDPGIPEATVFRPKALKPGAKFPVVAWGQGGCSRNGLSNPEFNAEIASHGYLMVADGTPNGQGNRPQTANYKDMGTPLIKYLDWAIAENTRPCSPYYQSLDTTKLAVFGWSCGGLMAEGASADPRITTFMINNSGMIDFDQKVADAMHSPMLILLGGTSDIAYPNGMNDYAKITKVPVVVASSDVGHGATYQADNGGSFARVNLAWLNWWLKGDEGATGKGLFLGANCGLCADAAWSIQSKNFP